VLNRSAGPSLVAAPRTLQREHCGFELANFRCLHCDLLVLLLDAAWEHAYRAACFERK
jgi:hypothetical protein